ncbi:MAG: hypothetical protein D6691_01520 [Candidatus Hydrogenedentota bacterium]|nr:MAG: hypothetical protein D6691_01520 [Candidatus Hydrogenedentota bacterium]
MISPMKRAYLQKHLFELLSSKRVCILLFIVLPLVAALSGCSMTRGGRYTPKRGDLGFKKPEEVAPHARAMVEGKMSLADCLRQPESIRDGGVGCMRAIRDLPVPTP